MANKSFLHIKKNLKKDFSKFKKISLAILGDSSTQFLNIAIKGSLLFTDGNHLHKSSASIVSKKIANEILRSKNNTVK